MDAIGSAASTVLTQADEREVVWPQGEVVAGVDIAGELVDYAVR